MPETTPVAAEEARLAQRQLLDLVFRSQGVPRSLWDYEYRLLSDKQRDQIAKHVDHVGKVVTAGAVQAYRDAKHRHATRVREAKAASEKAKDETGKSESAAATKPTPDPAPVPTPAVKPKAATPAATPAKAKGS